MMELFDKKFVHFMWDSSLDGKKGFLADDIGILKDLVNDGDLDSLRKVSKSTVSNYSSHPFYSITSGNTWRFFYYDLNYEVKCAYNEGKQIQVGGDGDVWVDWVDERTPDWDSNFRFRIKPEEEKWIVYLYNSLKKAPYLTACAESCWDDVQKDYGAKTKLFVGTESECEAWYESKRHLAEVIKAWEDGKTIQFLRPDNIWQDCTDSCWLEGVKYRVKPAAPTAGFLCDSCELDKTEKCNPRDCMSKQLYTRKKPKRMTYRQLAEWLAKANGQVRLFDGANEDIHISICDGESDKQLPVDYEIRRWGTDKWIEPTVDEYLKDCII